MPDDNCNRLDLFEALFAKYVRKATAEGDNSPHHIIAQNTDQDLCQEGNGEEGNQMYQLQFY